MNSDWLILKRNPDNGLVRNLRWCKVAPYYETRYNNLLLRLVRKLRLYCFVGFFLGSWKQDIGKYKVVILFDNGYHKTVARYIRKHNPNCRIILWFWNKIFDENEKYLKDKELDEVWSYDRRDCKRFELNFNTQFYNKENIVGNKDIRYDVLFVGADKGRRAKIESFSKIISDAEMTAKIIIPRNESEHLSYKEYLDLLQKSRSILEIMEGNARGLTVRSLESLSCNKKLITNNEDITNYDFYKPENIFILGVDDIRRIKEFIRSPYKSNGKDIVEYYEFENWLKRFKKEEK